ncbi:MAG: PaaI family thioesterase [SAR324 cluster bacterium]|nr:PaaI family thioesterase [SAR324 cluster bacterium]
MDMEDGFKKMPNRFEGNCFGCSETNSMGLQMKFWWNEHLVRSKLIIPDHLCGWNKLIHGGVVSTILDEVMSWATIYSKKQMVMTKTMTIDFIRPIQIGDEILAEGEVLEITGKHAIITEGRIFDHENQLCARSKGHFVTFSQKVGKKLGIISPDTPDPFKIDFY